MSFPTDPLDITCEMYTYINDLDQWVDITEDVRNYGDIPITRGRLDERSRISYGRARININNRDGTYSDENPNSIYYGYIGRNTPFRIGVRPHATSGTQMDAADAFPRTVSNSWGSADTGGAWTTGLGSGTVTAANWNVASGVGTMALAAAPGVRRSTLAAISTVDADHYVTIKAPQATGASLEAGISMRETSGGTYALCKISLTTTNTVVATIVTRDGLGSAGTTITGLTHTGTGQPLRIRARCIGPWVMMKVWIAANSEPADWQLTNEDTSDLTGPATGWSGVYAGALTGNTNVKPVTIQYDDFSMTVESCRLLGEVVAWPQVWDPSGNDCVSPIEVVGPRRRLDQGTRRLKSAIRRYVESLDPDAAYWPGEDVSGSTSVASAIGQEPLLVFGNSPASFGSNGPDGGDGAIKFADGTGLLGDVGGDSSATEFTLMAVVNIPDAPGGDTQITNLSFTGGTYKDWVLTLFPSGSPHQLGLEIFDATGVNRLVLSQANWTIGGLNNRYTSDQIFWLSGRQNGANVEYEWFVYDIALGPLEAMGATGSYAGTMGYPNYLRVPFNYDHIDWEYSHLALWSSALDDTWGSGSMPDVVTPAQGHVGETAAARFARLCNEEGIPYVEPSAAELIDTAAMGVQGPAKVIDLLDECANADLGVLMEARDSFALKLRTNGSMINQTSVALDYEAFELSSDPPTPVKDDQSIWNKVTASRVDGSSFTTEQATGPLNIQNPKSDRQGVGEYDRGAYSANVQDDDQLPAIAGWLKHQGTWDESRWRGVTIEGARSTWLAASSRWTQMAALDTGDLFSIDNTPVWMKPGVTTVMVQGMTETLRNRGWEITYDTTPGDIWTVAEFGSATTAHLESSGLHVNGAHSSGATSLEVRTYHDELANNDIALWTEDAANFPVSMMVGGEEINVTAATHTNIAFRSVGTVAHGNNASVAPGAPAGRVAGDLLIIIAAIRSTSATVTEPTGYETLHNAGNFKIFGRIATATGTDLPTIAFSGGAAGDDTSARIVCFSGKYADIGSILMKAISLTNASAADVAYPGVNPKWANCLVIVAAWKQDDWTSIAALSGMSEAVDSATTTGNDQAIGLDYVVQTTRTLVSGGNFTVTGGAAAISKSVTLVIRSDVQTFTVQRAQNGISKAIVDFAPLTLKSPLTLGR
jgi:hypothetical protein